MIALPTAYTARQNALANAIIPDALQTSLSDAIASAIADGRFFTDFSLSSSDVPYGYKLVSWLQTLGYQAVYSDQPNQTGSIEITWGR